MSVAPWDASAALLSRAETLWSHCQQPASGVTADIGGGVAPVLRACTPCDGTTCVRNSGTRATAERPETGRQRFRSGIWGILGGVGRRCEAP